MTTLSTGKFDITPSDGAPRISTGTPSYAPPSAGVFTTPSNIIDPVVKGIKDGTINEVDLGEGMRIIREDNGYLKVVYPEAPPEPRFLQVGTTKTSRDNKLAYRNQNLLSNAIANNPKFFNPDLGVFSKDELINFTKSIMSVSGGGSADNAKAFAVLGYDHTPTSKELGINESGDIFGAILTAVAAVIAAPVVLPAVAAAAGAIGAGVGTLVNAVGGAAGAVGNAVGGAAGAVGGAVGAVGKVTRSLDIFTVDDKP